MSNPWILGRRDLLEIASKDLNKYRRLLRSTVHVLDTCPDERRRCYQLLSFSGIKRQGSGPGYVGRSFHLDWGGII